MRICLLLLYLAFFSTAFCQTNLRGVVLDNAKTPIQLANVQLQINGKTVKYTSTNEKGEFTIDVGNIAIENAVLKASHIAYDAATVTLKKGALDELVIIKLSEKKQDLHEVIVQSKLGVAKAKGDTLSYNLKALTTGNEEKLRDVLKKLPGIEINEEGKITSQGKVINDLLINGKKMFGDNHQIATDNINAEMLDAIDLMSNYETFGAVKEIEGSNKTALNVKIKKEYLGKITGNVETLGAYDNRYKVHSNLFKFNTKFNVSSVFNLNNTGYQPLSSKDYFSMNRSVRQDLRNNDASNTTSLTAEDIPAFLLSDENVSSKKSEFASFDIAYHPNKNVQLNGFSIFNKLKTNEDILSTKSFLDTGNSISIRENTYRTNRLFYNQSKFNIDYKPSKNTLWNYTVLFDLNLNNSKNTIFNNLNDSSNIILNNTEKWYFSLGHQLSFIRRVSKNKLLSFNIYHETKNQDNDLDINSNASLFGMGKAYEQNNKIKKTEIGLYAKYTQRIQKQIFRFNVGFSNEYSTFGTTSSVIPNGFSKTSLRYFSFDISLQKNIGKFNYKTKVETRAYFMQNNVENADRYVLLPSLLAKYNFTQTRYLLASYNRTLDFPKIEKLNNFNFAEDFRTFVSNSPIRFNTLLQQDVFSLNYFSLNLYNGIVLAVNSSYVIYDNKLSTNTSKITNYNAISPIVTNNQFAWNNSLTYEYRISKLKTKFKLNVSYIKSNFINQINSLSNRQNSSLINVKISFISNFKKAFLNYEFGVNYSSQQTKYDLFNQLNAVERLTPFVSFNGVIAEKWSYYIDNAYEQFTAQAFSSNFYNLGIKLKYKSKKMRYWLEGNNLLYINNAQIIKASSTNNILSTEIVNRLAGYIGFGIGFDL